MGVLYCYYAADDDQDAARAIVREDGAPSGAGYDQVVVKGIDPMVELATAEALIMGREREEIVADPRRCALVAMVGDGEVAAVSLTDVFRDELARVDASLLPDVAAGWARSPGAFYKAPEPDALAGFLADLAALASRALAGQRHLYCWICP
ncbi:hypothetical protein AB0M28_00235 [Streptomyces sp. NPDC051940]|uniref:hypothetical protein n=1 Tax=Streptomyces sp. NPDC051940 TaxID=3155675 RepID=UPI00342E9813